MVRAPVAQVTILASYTDSSKSFTLIWPTIYRTDILSGDAQGLDIHKCLPTLFSLVYESKSTAIP